MCSVTTTYICLVELSSKTRTLIRFCYVLIFTLACRRQILRVGDDSLTDVWDDYNVLVPLPRGAFLQDSDIDHNFLMC